MMKITTSKILVAILVISVVLRVAVALMLGDQVVELPGTADQISYHTLALRVLGGYGFSHDTYWWPATAANAPTAHWSYLYTFYLVIVYTVFGPHPVAARLIQAIAVGILQPYLLFLLTRRTLKPFSPQAESIGLIAAALCAFYTYFIYYSGALMTEPFFITSILASLYLAVLLAERLKEPANPWWGSPGAIRLLVVFGLVIGAALLLRQLVMLVLPLLLLWIWWQNRRKILPLMVPVGVVIAMMLPFTWYNYVRFHRFVPLNTNSGFVLYWANHPIYGRHFIPILTPEEYNHLIPPELLSLDEAALDQALLHLGVRFILDDPVRYFFLSLSRIPIYFDFLPSRQDGLVSNLARVGGFGLYLPFMIFGLIGSLIRLEKREKSFTGYVSSPVFLLAAFALAYSAIHILTWTLVRYRLPVDAVLMVFAGWAVFDLVTWLLKVRERYFPPLKTV
jgi:4-amino-4-deoxy-L-arabinose transferase-like glycosyltransferase